MGAGVDFPVVAVEEVASAVSVEAALVAVVPVVAGS